MTDVHVHVRLKRLRAPWAASSLDLGEEHLGRVKVCIVTVEPTVGHHLDRRAQARRVEAIAQVQVSEPAQLIGGLHEAALAPRPGREREASAVLRQAEAPRRWYLEEAG